MFQIIIHWLAWLFPLITHLWCVQCCSKVDDYYRDMLLDLKEEQTQSVWVYEYQNVFDRASVIVICFMPVTNETNQ